MTPEWDANIQAIGNIFDRDRAEIASLKDQLIERLAEINEKDREIEKLKSEVLAANKSIVLIYESKRQSILELEGQLATALREREGR